MPCKLPERMKILINEYAGCSHRAEFGSSCMADLDDKIRDWGGKYLGQGAFRATWRFKPGCVVKVAMNAGNRAENEEEVGIWMKLPKKAKPLFLKPEDYDPDYWWLTQAEAEKTEGLETYNVLEDLETDLRMAGLVCYDLHEANIGTRNGRGVIIDYGQGISCSPEEVDRVAYLKDEDPEWVAER